LSYIKPDVLSHILAYQTGFPSEPPVLENVILLPSHKISYMMSFWQFSVMKYECSINLRDYYKKKVFNEINFFGNFFLSNLTIFKIETLAFITEGNILLLGYC
jgi:hypothetical protein